MRSIWTEMVFGPQPQAFGVPAPVTKAAPQFVEVDLDHVGKTHIHRHRLSVPISKQAGGGFSPSNKFGIISPRIRSFAAGVPQAHQPIGGDAFADLDEEYEATMNRLGRFGEASSAASEVRRVDPGVAVPESFTLTRPGDHSDDGEDQVYYGPANPKNPNFYRDNDPSTIGGAPVRRSAVKKMERGIWGSVFAMGDCRDNGR